MSKAKTATAAAAPEYVATATIADDEIENYGGDISAWDATNTAAGFTLALRSAYLPGTLGFHLPDLNPPGTFVRKDAPELRFHWAWWEDNGTAFSKQMFTAMRSKGYKPALASEWLIHPDLRDTIIPDSNDRLTFAASKDGAHVVMYQSETDFRADRKIMTRDSDLVQQTAEERAAQLQEELERGGLRGARASFRAEKE